MRGALEGEQLQSGQVDSPRRLATAAAQPQNTPLLKASLSTPPVAHSPIAVAAAAVAATNTNNGSMDLSMQRRQPLSEDNPSRQPTTNAAEMYSTLLLQLRQERRSSFSPPSPRRPTETASAPCSPAPACSPPKKSATGLSGSASSQPKPSCFACPVCKKRFQRHIALSAHFQAEHVGHHDSGDARKVCRLCSHRAKTMADVRKHLLASHGIDLETPTACLAEDDEKSEESLEEKVSGKRAASPSSPSSSSSSPSGRRASHKRPAAAATVSPSTWRCPHCQIVFPNQTLYFLHRGFHSDNDPWRCNGCRVVCSDMYDFNTHLVSCPHN